jgi:glycosyltransferase involved in cell wall biosynthesis
MTTNTKPLASILCATYNQKEFIAQTIEGFLMQKVDFPIEIIINDDASTDGTAEIIRQYASKYPDIIKPIFQAQNQYSQKVDIWQTILYPAAQGKYIAECEGDDYWTDPNKLQKQVSFLEEHPEYGLTYGLARQYIQEKKTYTINRGCDFISFENFLKQKNCIPTLTACYRKDILLKYYEVIQPSKYGWKMGDLPVWLWFIHNSKVKYFPEIFGTYRILKNSAAHSSDIEKQMDFYKSCHDCANFFSKLFLNKELPPFDEHQRRAHLYSTRAHDREKAYKEYKLIPEKNLKYRILTLFHSTPITYLLLRIYYSLKYKQ